MVTFSCTKLNTFGVHIFLKNDCVGRGVMYSNEYRLYSCAFSLGLAV
jgi:hypothetical protein